MSRAQGRDIQFRRVLVRRWYQGRMQEAWFECPACGDRLEQGRLDRYCRWCGVPLSDQQAEVRNDG
jgi:hypothetical protein